MLAISASKSSPATITLILTPDEAEALSVILDIATRYADVLAATFADRPKLVGATDSVKAKLDMIGK